MRVESGKMKVERHSVASAETACGIMSSRQVFFMLSIYKDKD